jgi:hypothetical protein
MATAQPKGAKELVFEWEGKDRNGKIVRGEMRAVGENQVLASLRRQGILPGKVKKRKMSSGKKITPKDLTIFTRQLATMMKAGVPLLQPQRHTPAQRHSQRCRNGHLPEHGLSQIPALLRQPVLQLGRGRRAGRHPRPAA